MCEEATSVNLIYCYVLVNFLLFSDLIITSVFIRTSWYTLVWTFAYWHIQMLKQHIFMLCLWPLSESKVQTAAALYQRPEGNIWLFSSCTDASHFTLCHLTLCYYINIDQSHFVVTALYLYVFLFFHFWCYLCRFLVGHRVYYSCDWEHLSWGSGCVSVCTHCCCCLVGLELVWVMMHNWPFYYDQSINQLRVHPVQFQGVSV